MSKWGHSGGWDWTGRVPVQDEINSKLAAASVEDVSPYRRERAWVLARERGPLASWQAQPLLGLDHQSCSPIFTWLRQHGRVVEVGRNRTPSGRLAWIWKAITKEEAEANPVGPMPLRPSGSPRGRRAITERGTIRIEREGRPDQYLDPKKAEAQSRDAARQFSLQEEIRRKMNTPLRDPRTIKIAAFGGPRPCEKCGGTGGNLWERCVACGGEGVR